MSANAAGQTEVPGRKLDVSHPDRLGSRMQPRRRHLPQSLLSSRRTFLRTTSTLAASLPLMASAQGWSESPSQALARRILADTELDEVLRRGRALLTTGLTAGEGYGEVWIRDLNTFIEIALEVNPPALLREALLTFFRFQGADGNIVDGYIPEAKANISYKYRRSDLAPGLLAHKNTVETDQESSLVQAVARYCRITGDRTLLEENVGGIRVSERLENALAYLLADRYSPEYGLLWGATTADWGDVQPEHEWGVELDEHSHRAIDIYDNALFLVAIEEWIQLQHGVPGLTHRWGQVRDKIRAAVRRHLWDEKRGKFIPHLYLHGSPFPPDFDEGALWYHGGTALAMEAGLLSHAEIVHTLNALRKNVRDSGAPSLGLTVYPPYPDGFFKNRSMGAWSYQNGGDWCWFGGRLIRQLLRHGLVEEAYLELKPMVSRVIKHNGFFEWWSRDNQPRGSGLFRGSAGVLGQAIRDLHAWATTTLA